MRDDNWSRCACGELLYVPSVFPHTCLPVWEVNFWAHIDGTYDEWHQVRAQTAKQAARIGAQKYNSESAEYPEQRWLWVRKDADSAIEIFEVLLQMVPEYSATKLGDRPPVIRCADCDETRGLCGCEEVLCVER